jgi:hypothetical protein
VGFGRQNVARVGCSSNPTWELVLDLSPMSPMSQKPRVICTGSCSDCSDCNVPGYPKDKIELVVSGTNYVEFYVSAKFESSRSNQLACFRDFLISLIVEFKALV